MHNKSLSITQPRRIEFGPGCIRLLPACLREAGHTRVLIVCDQSVEPLAVSLQAAVCEQGLNSEICTEVMPEPTFSAMEQLLRAVDGPAPDVIVGFGGGSALDMAKLLCVLLGSSQSIPEIIGIGKVAGRERGLYTVPTTSGTGSEVTPIAVLTDESEQLKKGVVSTHLVADAAFVDPELTLGLPPAITAATGIDALTHCIEAYLNVNHQALVDGYALTGIQLIARHLERAVSAGADLEARSAMSLGSLSGGLCLGPVNTAAVHALAYPLGGEFHIPHGVSNACLLPYVMEFNRPACADRMADIAAAMALPISGLSADEAAERLVAHLAAFSRKVGIPASLRELNIPEDAIPRMAAEAIKVRRLLDNNPRPVSVEDASAIFRAAWAGSVHPDLGERTAEG